MMGTLLTNQLLKELVEDHVIEFFPNFNSENAQIAQYPLTVKAFLKKNQESAFDVVHDFKKSNEFIIQPHEYVIAEIHEQVILPKGIVGRFISASNLIESGLGLTAGKLEFPFGRNNERIRFGLKNLTDNEVLFYKDSRIAYIEFFDLRGLKYFDIELSNRDIAIYRLRYSINNDADINYDLE